MNDKEAKKLSAHIQALQKRAERAEAELERVRRQNAAMWEALGMNTAWPVHEVLEALALTVNHLFQIHDCDCAGHEAFSACMRIAYTQRAAIIKALADNAGSDFIPRAEAEKREQALVNLIAELKPQLEAAEQHVKILREQVDRLPTEVQPLLDLAREVERWGGSSIKVNLEEFTVRAGEALRNARAKGWCK